MVDLDDFLSKLPPPKYPFSLDSARANQGRPIYERNCSACHDPGEPRTNTPIPIDEIKTDRERLDTWTKAAADQANEAVKNLGITRPNMVKNFGYCSPPLDGLWLREPEARRTKAFYRGYDVYDPDNVGFISSGPAAQRAGWRLDVTVRGNGNQGHAYGTDLPEEQKQALLEYLKSF